MRIEMIECACGCGTRLNAWDGHYRRRSYISGHNGRKYNDPKQYKREYLERHRQKRVATKAAWRLQRRIELLQIAGGICADCGLMYDGTNGPVFDFHHEGNKDFPLNSSGMDGASWDEILREAEACALVCGNCHRMRHEKAAKLDAGAIRARNRKFKLMEERAFCEDCNRPATIGNVVCFDFHHRVGETKLFGIATKLRDGRWDNLKAEAAKCSVYCTNCHKLRHSQAY